MRTDRVRKYDYREVLSENIKNLMISHQLINSQSEISRHCDIPQRTVGRILNGETHATLGSIVGIATAFGLEPWQLLVPGLDPSNLPRLHVLTKEQAEALQSLSRAISDLPVETLVAKK